MANTFKSAASGSTTTIQTLYTCPAATSGVVHAIYLSNVDGTNDATISVAVSGSANFTTRRFILKTVDVPADSTVVIDFSSFSCSEFTLIQIYFLVSV